MCTLRNPRWIAAAKSANEKFVFEFSTSLCWLGLLFFALRNFFSSFPTSLSLTRVWMRRKKSFIFKRRSLFKILIYAMRLIQFSCSRYLWWLENVLFVSGRLAYIADRAAAQCAGKKNYNFWVNRVARTAVVTVTAAFRSRERWRNWILFFYYFRFISIFPPSDERSTIWHVNPFSRGFFLWRTHYTTCVAMGALSTALMVEFIRE